MKTIDDYSQFANSKFKYSLNVRLYKEQHILYTKPMCIPIQILFFEQLRWYLYTVYISVESTEKSYTTVE